MSQAERLERGREPRIDGPPLASPCGTPLLGFLRSPRSLASGQFRNGNPACRTLSRVLRAMHSRPRRSRTVATLLRINRRSALSSGDPLLFSRVELDSASVATVSRMSAHEPTVFLVRRLYEAREQLALGMSHGVLARSARTARGVSDAGIDSTSGLLSECRLSTHEIQCIASLTTIHPPSRRSAR